MSFWAWFYAIAGIAFLGRLIREAAKTAGERSMKRIVTDALFLIACIYMMLGRLGIVPRI